MATIIDNTNYQFVEATHTKKESKLYVIQLKNRVEDKFKLLTRRVENHGGYYSGHQKGFVFNRILSQKEIDEIFKGIFFEEKVELQKVDENKDAWNYTLEELKSIPVSKRGEDTFNFKYNLDGKLVNYSIKVPSGSIDDAFISLAKKIIGNALMSGKYNKAIEKGQMNPVRAAQIIKSLGYSLEQINQDFIELHPDIQAVWSMKKSNQEEVLDKVRFPYLYERSEMSHLSDKRYSQIINDAIDSNKYEKLIKDGVVSANKVAFIIESAGFEIPEGLLGEAISERKEEIESLVGGYADSQSIYDISEKHGVPIKEIIRQFKKGLKVEREHTKDKQKMGEIVKDHLVENPYYYDVLIQAEKTMEELDPSKFSSHDDYMKAFSEKEKELEGLSVEEIVELKARPIIDKIKYAHKQIGDGVPDEVESFLKNQILNHFISLFNDVVSEYIFYTPVWLDLQNEYLTENQRNKMLMYGIYNNAHYEDDVVNKFIENVIDSEMIFGSENKKLNNIFNLLPYSPFEVPSELEYDLNPKDKNLAEIVDAFVNKTKVLTSTLGVYFGKDGVFASKFTLDIFLKGKKGYLPKNNIEEGIYGLSNSAKNILPAYGAKRLNMLKDKKAIQFFQEYMATYGNEKGEFDKGISVLTHDQIQTMFKDMSVVYSSKAYKDYVKKEVDGLKLKVSSYSVLYIKQGANLFTICLHDFIEALAAIIKMGIDTVQFGVSKNGLYISENVSSLIRLEESGIRVSIKSKESEMPNGMIYYDLNKKEFVTNKLGNDSLEDGGNFDNLKKNDKFTDKITKDEINNIISGKSKVRNGDVIQTIANYIRGSKSASADGESSEYIKKQEVKLIKEFCKSSDLWIEDINYDTFIGNGSEQDVYLLDEKFVLKINYGIYYNSWLDYLNNLLLHNYFFPDTNYELIGFTQKNGFLVSVVRQVFVKISEKTDLQKVKKFLLNKGFINNENNDYYNPNLEIILQDLHDENVLTKNGILYFIDTVFYLKRKDEFHLKDGGEINNHKQKPLKKIIINNNAWYADSNTFMMYENEDGSGASMFIRDIHPQERAQVRDQILFDKPMISHFNDGGDVSEKPEILVHNNTNSASDKDAQKIISDYLKNLNDSGRKVFIKFLNKSNQNIKDYEAVFYVSKDYHDKYSNKFYSNKIIYQKYVADAYQNALNYDDANPSFIRMYRHGNIKGFAAVTEFDLFGDWEGDKYDEKGYLKKELKEQAIKQLKKDLFVEDNSEMKDGGLVKKNLTYLGEVGGDKIGEKSSLEKAKLLENKGVSSEGIRQETGWFMNPHDKKWRFEISDKDFKIMIDFNEIKSTFESNKKLKYIKIKLIEVIKHDKFFEAYPEFENILFFFFNENDLEISSLITDTDNKNHKIYLTYNIYDEKNRLTEFRKRRVQSARQIKGEGYMFILSFIDAFSERTRQIALQSSNGINSFRKNILIHELQHLIQIREGFGGGSSPERWYRKLLEEYNYDERTITDFQKSTLLLKAKNYYENSSGEIESTDVDFRLDFDDIKRESTIPLSLVKINPDYVNVELEKPFFENGGGIKENTISRSDLRKFIVQCDELSEGIMGIDHYRMRQKEDELIPFDDTILLSLAKRHIMLHPSVARAYKIDENTTIKEDDWFNN